MQAPIYSSGSFFCCNYTGSRTEGKTKKKKKCPPATLLLNICLKTPITFNDLLITMGGKDVRISFSLSLSVNELDAPKLGVKLHKHHSDLYSSYFHFRKTAFPFKWCYVKRSCVYMCRSRMHMAKALWHIHIATSPLFTKDPGEQVFASTWQIN